MARKRASLSRKASSVRLRAVMSSKTPMAPASLPAPSYRGAVDRLTSIREPSFLPALQFQPQEFLALQHPLPKLSQILSFFPPV